MLAHFVALAALAAAVVFIIVSLQDQYAYGRLDFQMSPCSALRNPLESLECRKAFVLSNESGPFSEKSRFFKTAAIFALLLLVAAVHVFSIFFVFKRLKPSHSRAGLRA